MEPYDVVVIGAGLGGLTAGAILSKRGRKVLVLEQSDRVGGCCSTHEIDGFKFDIGASVVEIIPMIDRAFRELGTTFEKEVDLIPCDPIYSVIFPDGTRASIPMSVEAAAEEIGRISPEDKAGFLRYAETFETFLQKDGLDFFLMPMNTLGDMLSAFVKRPVLMKFGPYFAMTYDDVLRKFFKNDKVRQSMAYQSFYSGHSPEQAVGVFAIIPYMEHKGIFYPRGGMIEIPLAIQRLGKQAGMEVRLNTCVQRVLVDANRKVRGVVTAEGETIAAKTVISNINARTLYLDMIGEQHLPWIVRKGIKSYALSKSTPYICLGVDYDPPLDAHHTLLTRPLNEINDFWWEKYRLGIAPKPEEQFGLICCPTKADPSLAPEGHHIVALDFQGPYHLAGASWDEIKEEFSEDLVSYLSDNVLPGLKEHTKTMVVSSPVDFERRLRNPGGAFYCFQQDISAQTVFRPAAKSKSIQGLYLAGASTHPGGGVPTVMASGIVAANLIRQFER
jgi:phytoene desaturase